MAKVVLEALFLAIFELHFNLTHGLLGDWIIWRCMYFCVFFSLCCYFASISFHCYCVGVLFTFHFVLSCTKYNPCFCLDLLQLQIFKSV